MSSILWLYSNLECRNIDIANIYYFNNKNKNYRNSTISYMILSFIKRKKNDASLNLLKETCTRVNFATFSSENTIFASIRYSVHAIHNQPS